MTAFVGRLPGLITYRLHTDHFLLYCSLSAHHAIGEARLTSGISKKRSTICSRVVFLHLTRATWHMRASVSVIHREVFLSNSITVSAATPDMHPARKKKKKKKNHAAVCARGGVLLTGVEERTPSTLSKKHTVAGGDHMIHPLHSITAAARHPTDDFMSKSILKLGRWGFGSRELIQS